jgi:bacterial leucyl aminopeptidase
MRHLLAIAIVAAACTGPDDTSSATAEERGPRFITIGADALGTAQDVLAARDSGAVLTPLAVENGIALLEYDAQDFLALSEQMHERHNRCSGFIRHGSIEDGRDALAAPTRAAAALTYTIDNGPTVNALMAELRASAILTNITELAAFKNRYYRSATGAQASDFIADKWRNLAAAAGRSDITVTQFTHADFGQKSVILTIPGSTLANEVVVLGAHEDSIAPGGSTSTAPGADDDASGIATLTEVLHALIAKNFHPLRTINIMAYAAEEVGLVGSQEIVDDFKNRGVNVVGVMQLDMTNFHGSDRDIWLMTDFTNPAQNKFVEDLIDTYTGATRGTDSCGYGCSDHASWFRKGFPASMPFESRFGEFDPNIHTPNDTLEVSDNNADHAVKFGRLGVAFAAELGKGTADFSHDLLREEFEVAGWTATGLWHRTTSSLCGPPGFSSPTHAMYFGQDAKCNFDTGARVSGTMTSPALTGITAQSTLRFRYYRDVQKTNISQNDVARVSVIDGANRTVVWTRTSKTASQPRWLVSDTISLAAFAGKSIQLRFEFDSITQNNNQFVGWLVDDVVVTK